MQTLEEFYGIVKKPVELKPVITKSGKMLEVFGAPSGVVVNIDFPEFTCLCPRTSHPDFALITLRYIPDKVCVELKSWKYYLNSYRNEGHFHEEVIKIIYEDIKEALSPKSIGVRGTFNVRGGTFPTVAIGDFL